MTKITARVATFKPIIKNDKTYELVVEHSKKVVVAKIPNINKIINNQTPIEGNEKEAEEVETIIEQPAVETTKSNIDPADEMIV